MKIDNDLVIKQAKKKFRYYPSDPSGLALKITEGLTNDNEKAIAIAYWIMFNLRYDFKKFTSGNPYQNTSVKTLKTRKGLCSEFAELYNEMARSLGIQSQSIYGYIHDFDHFEGDSLFFAEHAWNMVYLEGKWHLLDLTWSNGNLVQKQQFLRKLLFKWFGIPFKIKWKYVKGSNPFWLFCSPKEMAKTHLPYLPQLQLLETPLEIQEFENFLPPDSQNTYSSPQPYELENEFLRWKQLAKEGHEFNPKNNRVKGYFLSYATDSLYRKHLNPETLKPTGSIDNMYVILSHGDTAVLYLKKSMQDVDKSTLAKKRRNLNWKTRNKANNNLAKQKLKQSYSTVKKQQKAYRRAYTKMKSDARFSNVKARKLGSSQIKKTNVKTKPDSIFIQQIPNHLERINMLKDSLQLIQEEINQSFLSLDQVSWKKYQLEEEKLYLLLKNQKKYLRSILNKRFLILSIIHINDDLIEKRSFQNNLSLFNSTKDSETLQKLFLIQSDIDTIKILINQYYKKQNTINKLLKTIKKYGHDKKETELIFQEQKEKSTSILRDVSQQLLTKRKLLPEVKGILKKQRKLRSKIQRLILKDNTFENLRYNQYNHYLLHRRAKLKRNNQLLLKHTKQQVRASRKRYLMLKKLQNGI